MRRHVVRTRFISSMRSTCSHRLRLMLCSKTLEEPPEHVVFILCTTDPQKVPETIQSRCQRFDFHRISVESIVSRLGAICMAEGVAFDGEALDLIAHRADGGMRNALYHA